MSKLLIIEDNKDINAMLTEFLQREGFSVCSCFDGAEGMKEAKKNSTFASVFPLNCSASIRTIANNSVKERIE